MVIDIGLVTGVSHHSQQQTKNINHVTVDVFLSCVACFDSS